MLAMNEALFVVVRYMVASGCGSLVAHGWTIFNLDGATTDAVASVAFGAAGIVGMTTIGVLKSRVQSMLARLLARHKTALLTTAAEVPGVEKIIASPAVASATPSDKVVPPTQV